LRADEIPSQYRLQKMSSLGNGNYFRGGRQMSEDAGDVLRRRIQKARQAYMKAHAEYERVRQSVILESCSDQLTALLKNLEESRDRSYAEYQRLKALLGATEGT
jgi:hypothetical protein